MLHSVPKAISFDIDPKFTSNFLFKGFETNLNFSTSYKLESNGQIKKVNKVIVDMMRLYIMDKPSN
jgi:hypothetical protein